MAITRIMERNSGSSSSSSKSSKSPSPIACYKAARAARAARKLEREQQNLVEKQQRPSNDKYKVTKPSQSNKKPRVIHREVKVTPKHLAPLARIFAPKPPTTTNPNPKRQTSNTTEVVRKPALPPIPLHGPIWKGAFSQPAKTMRTRVPKAKSTLPKAKPKGRNEVLTGPKPISLTPVTYGLSTRRGGYYMR